MSPTSRRFREGMASVHGSYSYHRDPIFGIAGDAVMAGRNIWGGMWEERVLRDAKTSRAARSCPPDRTHGRLLERVSAFLEPLATRPGHLVDGAPKQLSS